MCMTNTNLPEHYNFYVAARAPDPCTDKIIKFVSDRAFEKLELRSRREMFWNKQTHQHVVFLVS